MGTARRSVLGSNAEVQRLETKVRELEGLRDEGESLVATLTSKLDNEARHKSQLGMTDKDRWVGRSSGAPEGTPTVSAVHKCPLCGVMVSDYEQECGGCADGYKEPSGRLVTGWADLSPKQIEKMRSAHGNLTPSDDGHLYRILGDPEHQLTDQGKTLLRCVSDDRDLVLADPSALAGQQAGAGDAIPSVVQLERNSSVPSPPSNYDQPAGTISPALIKFLDTKKAGIVAGRILEITDPQLLATYKALSDMLAQMRTLVCQGSTLDQVKGSLRASLGTTIPPGAWEGWYSSFREERATPKGLALVFLEQTTGYERSTIKTRLSRARHPSQKATK